MVAANAYSASGKLAQGAAHAAASALRLASPSAHFFPAKLHPVQPVHIFTLDSGDHLNRTSILCMDVDYDEQLYDVDDPARAFELKSVAPMSLEAANERYNIMFELKEGEKETSGALWDISGACQQHLSDPTARRCDPVAAMEIYFLGDFVHVITRMHHTHISTAMLSGDWHLEALHIAGHCYSVCSMMSDRKHLLNLQISGSHFYRRQKSEAMSPHRQPWRTHATAGVPPRNPGKRRSTSRLL